VKFISGCLGSDLQPATWRCAQIDRSARTAEEVILAVKLDELEGGA
jgi:hypothetical protein